jgi:choline dehydrogenase-like flavoprotein
LRSDIRHPTSPGSVERSLNVQTPERSDHNPANLTLLEGSRQLGYACKSVPQNISGSFADHARCGANCTIGCRGFLDGEGKKGKMSGCRVFLQPRLKAGRDEHTNIHVQGLDGFEIDRVVFSEPNDASGLLGLVPGATNQRAIGAIGTLQDRETGVKERLLILAERTVVSAGTLNSPAILLRSGLKVDAASLVALDRY